MIDVRELSEHAELAEAVRLQKQIWGFEEIDLLPKRLFVVATKIGGQVLGAFDGPRMVGFCLCIPGVKPGGKPYLHSHMMGVDAEYRNRGVGRMLKLRQRTDALPRGINLIEWTFDPLELKNAFFNIERLGAVVRRYVLNQYGTTSSHLHGGLPTDRCIAEWWIASPRVQFTMEEGVIPGHGHEMEIPVPVDIEVWRKTNQPKARDIQRHVSDQFMRAFEKNLAVTGFRRTETEGIYLLGPWDSK